MLLVKLLHLIPHTALVLLSSFRTDVLLAGELGEGVRRDPGLVHHLDNSPEQVTGLMQMQHATTIKQILNTNIFKPTFVLL